MKDIIFLLSCLVLSGHLTIHAEECQAPKKVVDREWNVTSDELLYLPIGQKNDTGLIKQILFGSSLNADQDLTKLCFRVQLKDDSILISGTNGTSAKFNCKKIDDKKWAMDCQQDGKKSEHSFKFYVTFSDKKSFALAIRCWSNGLHSWTVFSKTKFLHDDVQIQILEHVKSLGFETADSLPLRYKQCKN